MYALNPDTGAILWQTRTSGTMSRPWYMNGAIYGIGGGDGLLHALNADDGKYFWKIECPDVGRSSSANFIGYVTGADGRIYAGGGYNMYCYKAAK